MTREVRKDIVKAERHLTHAPFLHNFAVKVRADRLLANVDAAHNAGANRTEAALAFDAQHRARIGISEILRAYIVGRCESGQTFPHFARRDIAHWLADNRGDLPFIIQILAVGRVVEKAAMRVERGRHTFAPGSGI